VCCGNYHDGRRQAAVVFIVCWYLKQEKVHLRSGIRVILKNILMLTSDTLLRIAASRHFTTLSISAFESRMQPSI